MDLPVEFRSPRKGLIIIKKKGQKCFLLCHVRHINPSKEHPERIKKTDKKLLKNLIMMKLSFLFKKKILAKLKKRTTFVLMSLVMKMSFSNLPFR